MDNLAKELAKEARRLGLAELAADPIDPTSALAFANYVLEELAARGLLPQQNCAPGCWAQPRSQGH
ncbi:hypothetical protein GO986_21140 [Deinococcus sp. HMF7620]|uniref:Uncharacterized protein n=1 Tax=Deinococcus arboris TaxID=2682977 RepID=A0A7C9MTT2_9DEIO|nr:hypothetical protein [Deinococcus arboris]MVN89244.1 hypothetical protein [Deinococcus arboris]